MRNEGEPQFQLYCRGGMARCNFGQTCHPNSAPSRPRPTIMAAYRARQAGEKVMCLAKGLPRLSRPYQKIPIIRINGMVHFGLNDLYTFWATTRVAPTI